MLDPVLERFISIQDTWKSGEVNNIYLEEQRCITDPNGLLQFTESDLLKYFTTNDIFKMNVYINNHLFKISSSLYTLLENKYQLDFHISIYRLAVY